ncbi:MAG: acyltransferase [Lachnospiraceae bacterium]|nr:acyltransferase [Lachnospiraceae bacterium]
MKTASTVKENNKSSVMQSFTKEHTNIVKGVAIILMLIYHLFESAELLERNGVNYAPFSEEVFGYFTGFGNICVSVFVFLTAYGISYGLMGGESFDWKGAYGKAAKRFAKLMGNFLCLYISVNLLWGWMLDYASLYGSGKQGAIAMVTDALGLSMFFDTPTLNETWWYMELAYMLIFLVPLLAFCTRKIGWYILPAAFILQYVFPMHSDMMRYFPVVMVGICAAWGKWPERFMNSRFPLWAKYLIAVPAFVLCIAIRQNELVYNSYVPLADSVIVLFLVLFTADLLGRIPVVSKVFAFIGKHSMNIYLVHSFFYLILFMDYIYCVPYWAVTVVILLVISLLYSVLLELIKKGGKKLFSLLPGVNKKTNKA